MFTEKDRAECVNVYASRGRHYKHTLLLVLLLKREGARAEESERETMQQYKLLGCARSSTMPSCMHTIWLVKRETGFCLENMVTNTFN